MKRTFYSIMEKNYLNYLSDPCFTVRKNMALMLPVASINAICDVMD